MSWFRTRQYCYVSVLIIGSLCAVLCTGSYVNLYIDAAKPVSALHHFWKSTGMCPPLPHQNASDYFLSKDMYLNLLNIASVPHSGIKQVRMHWLLDMVTYNNDSKSFDFRNLDILMKTLQKLKMNPGFELMGSPSGIFRNFDDNDQVIAWMGFVRILAQRYIDMFGLDTVAEWNFETWNEPDHNDFDDVKMTVEGFLKYYDASSEGLRSAHPSLRFGGPGGSCRQQSFSKRCWALFDHCLNGRNYITRDKGSRLDYISMHKKGGGSSTYILESELSAINKIHSLHPKLSAVPIFNDEGDPMVGWSKPLQWRADAIYPAIVSKIIAQHQKSIISNSSCDVDYKLLSNDNGFLSYSPHYFTQRTLTARFQMNNTSPKHVHLVKKPIHALMVLLSKLGDVELYSGVGPNSKSDLIGVIASECRENCSNREVSVLLYASNDTSNSTSSFDVFLSIEKLINEKYVSDIRLMQCVINNDLVNPSKYWNMAGKPDFPTPDVFSKMHSVSEPYCNDPYKINVESRSLTLNISLAMPGVMLLQICWRPNHDLSPPQLISVTNITAAQVQVTWNDESIKSKCISSYQVQLCADVDCKQHAIVNKVRVISNSLVYIHASGLDVNVRGYYRVSVIDFWGRPSSFSNLVPYGVNK